MSNPRFITVTDREDRRVMVNLDRVEAFTDDDDGVSIVFVREQERASGEDWEIDFPGSLRIKETFGEIARAIGGVA